MKNVPLKFFSTSIPLSAALVTAGALFSTPLQAQDVVYFTTFNNNAVRKTCAEGYCPLGGTISGSGSTSISTAPGLNPSRQRATYGYAGQVQWSIQPTLNPENPSQGSVYKIEVSHTTASASQNVIVTASTSDGILSPSCTNSSVFNRSHAGNLWHVMGYITNSPNVTQPVITFSYVSGTLADVGSRLYIDAFKFTEMNPCSGVVTDVSIGGPLAAGQTYVNVLEADNAATNITVYADGSPIGELTGAGIVAGSNAVPTSALYVGAEIKATQTKNGCTSSLAGGGLIVGSGANVTVKAFLTCWSNAAYAGPIGTNSTPPPSGVYYALKGSGLTSGSQSAPLGGEVLPPSQCWQTVTFNHASDNTVVLANGVSLSTIDPWCALDGLAFAIDWEGTPDSGPYDIYVDQIKNGDVVIEDFESYAVGSTSRFSNPNQATLPNAGITYISAPNSSTISTNNSFDGSKSCRIQWQWNGIANARWARIQANATPGKNYPQIDTSKPITVRYLVLPVAQTTNQLSFPSVPADRTNSIGTSTTFSVQAAGEGPFTYQWQFEGSDITDATGTSYSKSGLQLGDTGVYSVVVNNSTGCSATNTVKLTVTEVVEPPTLNFSVNGNQITLTWDGNFVLQQADALTTPTVNWQDIQPTASSPYNVTTSGEAKYFRLRQ